MQSQTKSLRNRLCIEHEAEQSNEIYFKEPQNDTTRCGSTVSNFQCFLTDGVAEYGHVDKEQCFQSCGVYPRGLESCHWQQTISKQLTQLSVLPRSVNEYSEVTLRAQAIVPKTNISCLDANVPRLPLKQMLLHSGCLLVSLLRFDKDQSENLTKAHEWKAY